MISSPAQNADAGAFVLCNEFFYLLDDSLYFQAFFIEMFACKLSCCLVILYWCGGRKFYSAESTGAFRWQ